MERSDKAIRRLYRRCEKGALATDAAISLLILPESHLCFFVVSSPPFPLKESRGNVSLEYVLANILKLVKKNIEFASWRLMFEDI